MSLPRPSTYPRSLALIIFLLALFGPALRSAAQQTYPAKIQTARSTWQRDSNRIADILGKLRDHATTCNRLVKDIEKSEDEIRQAEQDLAEQLREMAEGRFCSECLRSASQLERGGEPFLYHVRKVKGIAIPASPEQFEKARQDAAEKIASIKRRLSQQREEKKKASDALNGALHELTVMIATYHRDITVERDLQIAAWAAEAGDWEKKLAEQQSQLDALAKQTASVARDVQIRAADAQLRSSSASTSAAETRARQTATAFGQAIRKDMDYLAKKAEGIPPGQPLVDGWFIGKNITSQNITYVTGPVRRPQSSNAAQLLKSSPAPSSSSPATPEKSVSDLLKGK
jgi:hypothetical protein